MRRLTCNNSIAYLKNLTDNFFQIFFMGTSWVAVSINNITTRASREMTSRKNINIFDFNGVNVAKHWHVAGRGICHLWLPCFRLWSANNSMDAHTINIGNVVPVVHNWSSKTLSNSKLLKTADFHIDRPDLPGKPQLNMALALWGLPLAGVSEF